MGRDGRSSMMMSAAATLVLFLGAEALMAGLAGIDQFFERLLPTVGRGLLQSRGKGLGGVSRLIRIPFELIPILPDLGERLARRLVRSLREQLWNFLGGDVDVAGGMRRLRRIEGFLPLAISPISFICFA
jgi:hypothetical protein